MKNPYVRLIVRLSVVLVAVILISKIHVHDEHVLAQAGAEKIAESMKNSKQNQHDKTNKKDNPYLIEVAGNDKNDFENSSKQDDSDTKQNDLINPWLIKSSDEEQKSETVNNQETGQTGTLGEAIGETSGFETESETETDAETVEDISQSDEVPSEETTEEPKGPDPNDPTLYVGLTELQAAELHGKLDPEYKNDAAYINALLVTHPDHYDEAIVNEARSIPLETNDDRYMFLTGKGYKAYTTKDLPDRYSSESRARNNMVTFDVPVWKMSSSGRRYSSVWSITVNEKLAASVRCIFSDIYLLDMKFPFNYLKGFNYRKVGGSGLMSSPLMSIHAFGAAIDINYWDPDNDYFLGKGNDLRDKSNPYCIPDEVIDIFADYGWNWGGNFDICADTMHFQYFGLEFLQYESDEPFPILYRGADDMNSIYINNLAKRLVRLGYLDEETSRFSKKVDAALKAFQEDYELEPDGIADYETWVPLINATHDMSYVF